MNKLFLFAARNATKNASTSGTGPVFFGVDGGVVMAGPNHQTTGRFAAVKNGTSEFFLVEGDEIQPGASLDEAVDFVMRD